MEKLHKFVIYLAIGIALTIFVLVLYTILPFIIENSSRDWDRVMGTELTEDDIKAMFYAEHAYVIFKEKYPDAIESFESREKGEGRIDLVMYNYTNYNEVRLNIDYNRYRENVQVSVNCQVNIPGNERDMRRNAHGDGVVDFIEKMDCLNISLISDFTPTGYSEYVTIPQIDTID